MKRVVDYVRQQAEAHRAMAANETDVKAKAQLCILAAEWDAVGDRHEQLLRLLVPPLVRDRIESASRAYPHSDRLGENLSLNLVAEPPDR